MIVIDDNKICEELAKIGINVAGVYDLVNSKASYPEAIPVLVNLLQYDFSNEKAQEGIVRALTVKEAIGIANKSLLRLYEVTPKAQNLFRWTIGNAFTVVMTREDVPDVLRIVRSKGNGMSRQMFVLALGKFNNPEIERTLIELLDDDEVVIQAISALRKVKSVEAIPIMERLANSPRQIIRNLAKQYLRKVG